MSMSYGAVYGYGLNAKQLETINQEAIALFIKKRSNEFNKIWEDCKGKPLEDASLKEIIDFFYDYESDTGAYSQMAMIELIAEVMTKETGIRFAFVSFEENMALLFTEAMPWRLNEKEKALNSVEDLQKVFQPYLCDLGLPEEKIDAVEVEWWG